MSGLKEFTRQRDRLAKALRAIVAIATAALGDAPGVDPADVWILPSGGVSFAELEKSMLLQALNRTRWNQTKAGELLGWTRDQVSYRMKTMGLEKPQRRLER